MDIANKFISYINSPAKRRESLLRLIPDHHVSQQQNSLIACLGLQYFFPTAEGKF